MNPAGRAAVRGAAAPAEGAVVTRAVLRAAARLGVTSKVLGRILGVSEATVSRMGSAAYVLEPGSKPFELAVLFVRLFRSLDAIVGGDEAVARAWLANENLAFGRPPVDLIQTVSGLTDVAGYLDARRALV